MESQIPTAINNWVTWHTESSKSIVSNLFSNAESRNLVLSFRYRSSLEENTTCLDRYLKVVPEYKTEIELIECKGKKIEQFYDLIGTTDQGVMNKDRLMGWLKYMIEVGHEFGCWLECWEVTNESNA